MELEWYNLIQKSLLDELSKEEKEEFDQLLQTSQDFRKAFDMQESLMLYIRMEEGIKDKQRFQYIDTQMRKESNIRSIRTWSAMAASIALIVGLGLGRLTFNSSTDVVDYDENTIGGITPFEQNSITVPIELIVQEQQYNTDNTILLERIIYHEDIYIYEPPNLRILTTKQALIDSDNVTYQSHLLKGQLNNFLKIEDTYFLIQKNEEGLPLIALEKPTLPIN